MRRCLCLGLICGMMLWSGSAWALSMAETVCYLDWGSLSISGNADYEWPVGNQYTYLRADARNDLESIEGTPDTYFTLWGDYSQTTNVPYAVGIAETYRHLDDGGTVDQLHASTFAEADGSVATNTHATANVRRSSDIMVLATSQEPIMLDFSIDYYIFHDAFFTEEGEDADVYTEMHFTFGGVRQDSVVFNQLTDLNGLSGTMSFSATLTSGIAYGLEADIYTTSDAYSTASAAPVPEPSTMVLMGIGLLGMAGYGRKRLKP